MELQYTYPQLELKNTKLDYDMNTIVSRHSECSFWKPDNLNSALNSSRTECNNSMPNNHFSSYVKLRWWRNWIREAEKDRVAQKNYFNMIESVHDWNMQTNDSKVVKKLSTDVSFPVTELLREKRNISSI